MKTKFILIVLSFFIYNNITAQNKIQCAHCNMKVTDTLHNASVINTNQKLDFDAIECLLNYTKLQSEGIFSSFKVSDYSTGEKIPAQEATYLISTAIKSPMGANLTAFKSKEVAIKELKQNGGEIFSWSELKSRFENQENGTSKSTHHHNRSDNYAPSGIMGDHLHPKGGFMVSLRYMYMNMNGNLQNNKSISDEVIFKDYMIAPQKMNMQMYMLGLMYAPSDKITLMVMQNFIKKNMDMKAMMMMNEMMVYNDFSTKSDGLGDLHVSALIGLMSNNKNSIHINTGLSIPIGSIENTDNTPMMQNAKLPYAMQLGSGTFDFLLGATYKGMSENWSWGIQPLSIIRTGDNSEKYRLGNQFEINSWMAYNINNNISSSIRLSGQTVGKIKGEDPQLNPMMAPTANKNNYGGETVNSAVGLNFLVPNINLLFGVEVEAPLYQNYNGIFMDEKWGVNSTIKYIIR